MQFSAAKMLRRMARDEGGNVIVLMAAALLPIIGLIGSGLDLTRSYLVKSKLQTACDAASLATRRNMAGGILEDDDRAEGRKFFNFNFPSTTMGSSAVNLTIEPDPTDISRVVVRADTTVPTSIMAIFKVESLPVSVQCSADQDYVNNDVMLVLDVTGSMNCTAGTSCSYAASEQSGSRVSRLRTATESLYNALKDAKGVRTRYGFMPYSMTVNVGRSLDINWIREPAKYWQKPGTTWVQSTLR